MENVSAKKLINDSVKSVSAPKFQRMSMIPQNETAPALGSSTTTTTTPLTTIDTSIDLSRVWKVHNEHDHNIPILNEYCHSDNTTIDQACQLFQICVSNLTQLVEETEAKLQQKNADNIQIPYDPVKFHQTWYEFVTIQVAFYGGLLLGTLFGAIILFILKLISDCVTMSNTETNRRTRRKRSK